MHVDAIQPYQIIIMVVFLLLLMMMLLFVRRFLGGLSKHIHRTKRMRHIEDMGLAPHQRLHLVEVDGQLYLIHTGKGHSATIVVAGGVDGTDIGRTAEAPITLMDIQEPTPKASSIKPQKVSKRPLQRTANAASSDVSSTDKQGTKANVDQIASAIAEARRRNPSLGLGK